MKFTRHRNSKETLKTQRELEDKNQLLPYTMHQLSLILLHPTVKEKMHLQENTLFDIDLGVKVT